MAGKDHTPTTATGAAPGLGLPQVSARKHVLLVVDDEVEVTRSLYDLFRLEYRVLTANTGHVALDILAREPVQIILTDQQMPGMTGAELLSKVRTTAGDVIRLMMTGYADIKVVIEAINRGHVFRYIEKPWDPEELRLLLAQAASQFDLLAERRRLIHDLAAANRELRRTESAKTAFIELAGHELRTPVTFIQGMCDLMVRSLDRAVGPPATYPAPGSSSSGEWALPPGTSGSGVYPAVVIDGASPPNAPPPLTAPMPGSRVGSSVAAASGPASGGHYAIPVGPASGGHHGVPLGPSSGGHALIPVGREPGSLQPGSGVRPGSGTHAPAELSGGGDGKLIKLRDRLRRVSSHCRKLAEIVDRMLKTLATGRFRMDLNLVPVRLKSMVDELAVEMAPFLEQRSIRMCLSVAPESLGLMADRNKLHDVLENLVTNGIRFTPDGGRVTLEAEPSPDGERVTIRVRDTGVGIPPADLPHIFEPFYAARDVSRHSSPTGLEFGKHGTGLGLPIVKRFVELHGGTVRVDSRVGQGSVFEVELPSEPPITPAPLDSVAPL